MGSLQTLREERRARERVAAERERLILDLENERARLSALLSERSEGTLGVQGFLRLPPLEAFR